MASVSGVTMSIANGSSSLARNVTVSGTMSFDASDVGHTYHLAISLFGEDKSGDNLPASDPVGDDEIYVYKWGVPLTQKSYKVVTVSAPGSVPFTETRSVSNAKLDEDTGTVAPNVDPPLPGLPRRDEVYAKATLTGAPVSARSATVIAGFGV
jgi:hypothetical protein